MTPQERRVADRARPSTNKMADPYIPLKDAI